jgi:hypothetical protein
LLVLPDAVALLGAALVADGDPVAGARLIAAGLAWRAARGLAVGHPLTARLIADAQADLEAELTDATLAAAVRVGEQAPFGSLQALASMAPEPMTAATVIDLRTVAERTAAERTAAERTTR